MTVQELIDELSVYDGETEVKIQSDWGQFSVDYLEDDEDINGDKISIYITKMTNDLP